MKTKRPLVATIERSALQGGRGNALLPSLVDLRPMGWWEYLRYRLRLQFGCKRIKRRVDLTADEIRSLNFCVEISPALFEQLAGARLMDKRAKIYLTFTAPSYILGDALRRDSDMECV